MALLGILPSPGIGSGLLLLLAWFWKSGWIASFEGFFIAEPKISVSEKSKVPAPWVVCTLYAADTIIVSLKKKFFSDGFFIPVYVVYGP